jgi:hypothetical protein
MSGKGSHVVTFDETIKLVHLGHCNLRNPVKKNTIKLRVSNSKPLTIPLLRQPPLPLHGVRATIYQDQPQDDISCGSKPIEILSSFAQNVAYWR